MDKLKTTRFRRSAAAWRGILAAPENRELSHRALAAKLGCARGTVEFWRSPGVARRQGVGGAAAGSTPVFLRVEPELTAPVTPSPHATAARIELPGGAVIAFDGMPPPAYLATIARAIEPPRC